MAENFPFFKDMDDTYHYFRVKKTEITDMWGYEKFIKKNLKKRIHIPIYVFEKYVSFFQWNEDEKMKYYDNYIKERKQKVIDYFKDDKDYYFSGHNMIESWFGDIELYDIPNTNDKGKMKKPKKKNNNVKEKKMIKQEHSFEGMIDMVAKKIQSFMIKDKANRADTKAFLHTAHEAIMQYISNHFNKEQVEEYSQYKTQVIAGYIAIAFGYKISHTAPTKTNKQIQNAVKYTFNKK